MTARDAIYAMQRRGVDVHVATNHDIILRAVKPGQRIPDDVIAIARDHREAIAAFASEFMPVKGVHVDTRI